MSFAKVPCKEQKIIELMETYGAALKRLCYLYLKDVHLAEDAAQETLLKAYKGLDSFRQESSEKTWLMRIAVNTCRDMFRTAWFRRVDRRIALSNLPEPAHTPELPDDTVAQKIMALGRKDREVILLYYYQEMDIQSIAQALDEPQGTVKSRLSRARKKLHDMLEGWYFDEPDEA